MKNSHLAMYMISISFLIATVVTIKTDSPEWPLKTLAISLTVSYLIYFTKTRLLTKF